MTQLAETVDAAEEVWTIDTMPTSPFLEVEDELVEIRARYPEHIYQPTQELLPPKIRVRRAQAGTSAASHNNGTALTPVYAASTGGEGGAIAVTGTEGGEVAAATGLELQGTVTDEGGGVAGYVPSAGEQTVSLLGPHTVHFDDADINTTGVVCLSIPAGSVVIRAFAVFAEQWLVDTDAFMELVLTNVGNTDPESLTFYDAALAATSAGDMRKESAPDGAALIGVAVTAGQIRCKVAGYGTVDAGEADIYALIAEPAA